MKIRKNDNVMVISGNHKGSTGRVLKIFSKQQRVIVEGVNLIKRHTKPSQRYPNGGIIEKEGTIHISNVMLIDPKQGVPTRIGSRVLQGSGKKSRNRVRVAKKSDEIIVDSRVR